MRKTAEKMHESNEDQTIKKHQETKGTSKREAFEAKVEERVREYEEKASMHIVVPVYVRDAIRRNAAALGESANAYINNIFEQVVSPSAFA